MDPQLCVFWRPFSTYLFDPAHQVCLGRFIGSLWFAFSSFWTVLDTFRIPKLTFLHIYWIPTWLYFYIYIYIYIYMLAPPNNIIPLAVFTVSHTTHAATNTPTHPHTPTHTTRHTPHTNTYAHIHRLGKAWLYRGRFW